MATWKPPLFLFVLVVLLASASLSLAFVSENPGNTPSQASPKPEVAPNPAIQQAVQTFMASKGIEPWLTFDPRDGHLAQIIGMQLPVSGTTPEEVATNFLRQGRSFLAVNPDNLTLLSNEVVLGFTHVEFQVTYGSVPVDAHKVHIVLKGNTVYSVDVQGIAALKVAGTVPALDKAAAIRAAENAIAGFSGLRHPEIAELVIYTSPSSTNYSNLAYRVEIPAEKPLGDWIYYVDAITGTILQSYDQLERASGTIQGNILPAIGTDALSTRVFANENVTVGSSTVTSNSSGTYTTTATGTATSYLRGPYVNSYNDDVSSSSQPKYASSSAYSWTWNYAASNTNFDCQNVYYHINRIHDYHKSTFGNTSMDYVMVAHVHYGTNYANAYYDGTSGNIFLGDGDGTSILDCSKAAGVMYHEYSHGVVHHIFNPVYSGESGAMDEAWADYFASSLLNDPLIGRWVMAAAYQRNLTNTLQYPSAIDGEVHDDSRMYSAAMWSMRTALGTAMADMIVYRSLSYHPTTFAAGLNACLQADAALYGTGTLPGPHDNAIRTAFCGHGIGTCPSSDVTPPVLSSIAATGIGNTSATITWTTNEAANGQVNYGTTTSYGSNSTLVTTLSTSHSITLTSLTAGTLYHYRVKSADAASNMATSGDYSFTTTTSTDVTPPTISAVAAGSITSSGATITWATNEAANGQVNYGTTTSYGSNSTLVTTLTTSHSIALTGLTASTIYHFRVKSADAASNMATSGDYTFTTTAATAGAYTLTATTYSWVAAPNATGITGDDQAKYLTLPWTFTYYGTGYTQLYVCSNGFFTFGTSSTAYAPQTFPNSATPNAVIAPFWRDLNPSGGGTITYLVDTANNRVVVAWNAVKNYANTSTNTFEAIFYSDGRIIFQYQTLSTGITTSYGIENATGTIGMNLPSTPTNGTAWLFTPGARFGKEEAAVATAASTDPSVWVFPNPSVGKILIQVDLPEAADTRIDICDLLGRSCYLVTEAHLDPGRHAFNWDGVAETGELIQPGLYLVRVTAGDRTWSQEIVRTK